MAFKISKSVLTAASTGLMMGALAGCGGSTPPPDVPEGIATPPAEATQDPVAPPDAPAGDTSATAAEGKACCKGMNECKGKGGCRAGEHSCAGQNECKGQGGCNHHCPK